MPDSNLPTDVVLLWHFHQPEYGDAVDGAPVLPWTRLHALKDYADMVDLLARRPSIRATINVVPALLGQLRAFADGTARPDPFLVVARKSADELNVEERRFVVTYFLAYRRDTMARGLARVHELAARRGEHGREEVPGSVIERFDTEDLRDLQVLFHLAWCGPLLRADERVRRLIHRGREFTEEDKHGLLDLQDDFLRGVLGRFIDLSAMGHIEFSTSPFFHPILPLLCDTDAAHEALPNLRLPSAAFRHPGDAAHQVEAALRAFEATFGTHATGGWSPEGAISSEALRVLGDGGYRWVVSDEQVLFESLGERLGGRGHARTTRRAELLYRPWRLGDGPVVLFRDRELSELIGAGYAAWGPKLAAADFARRLERAGRQRSDSGGRPIVTVALDGENAWELYPNNGLPFLEALYDALEADPERIRTVQASEAARQESAGSLSRVTAGSWVDGTFESWIGHREKNRAWQLLEMTRREAGVACGEPDIDNPGWRALLAAEGSDWFWWLGDDHPTPFAEEFEGRFRELLRRVYDRAGLEPPAVLGEPIRKGHDPGGRRPVGPIAPVLDGQVTDYFEWLPAAHIRASAGSVIATRDVIHELHFGADDETLFLRLDPVEPPAHLSLGGAVVRLHFPGFPDRSLAVALPERGTAESNGFRLAIDRVVEIAVPLDSIPGDAQAYRFQVEVETVAGASQRVPDIGGLVLPRQGGSGAEIDWFV